MWTNTPTSTQEKCTLLGKRCALLLLLSVLITLFFFRLFVLRVCCFHLEDNFLFKKTDINSDCDIVLELSTKPLIAQLLS